MLSNVGGVKNELNGYMFCISFHCISINEIRVYLYIDTLEQGSLFKILQNIILRNFLYQKRLNCWQNL